MNIMEMRHISASYTTPSMEKHEMAAEGVLCQSVSGLYTEEWDVVDLSQM